MLQKNLAPFWNILWCFIIPTIYGAYRIGNLWDGFLIYAYLRWILSLHITWTVNSFSHLSSFGYRPYNANIKPNNSFILGFLTGNESQHNYHHTFPSDYASSEYSWGTEWNPSKLIIDFLALIGQVSDRNQATPSAIKRAKNKAIQQNQHKKVLKELLQKSKTN